MLGQKYWGLGDNAFRSCYGNWVLGKVTGMQCFTHRRVSRSKEVVSSPIGNTRSSHHSSDTRKHSGVCSLKEGTKTLGKEEVIYKCGGKGKGTSQSTRSRDRSGIGALLGAESKQSLPRLLPGWSSLSLFLLCSNWDHNSCSVICLHIVVAEHIDANLMPSLLIMLRAWPEI